MSLYPAQRPAPRIAKFALKNWLRVGLPWPVTRFEVRRDAPFTGFLCDLAGQTAVPEFALLSGNPDAPGRRFVLLIFNLAGQPLAVVKAGVGPMATSLITREADFLSAVSSTLSCVPRLTRRLTSDHVAAFATPFFPGESPLDATPGRIGTMLADWADTSRTVALSALPQWKRLSTRASVREEIQRITESLGKTQVHPVVAHGDFVPWNIKVGRDGRWTVLDWDRGEQQGVPAWDWFHFVIQTGILVKQLSADQLCHQVTCLLDSAPFKKYAATARIEGLEGALLHAYLLHAIAVFNPVEGPSLPGAMIDKLFPGREHAPGLAAR
jgi:hypothetical protein